VGKNKKKTRKGPKLVEEVPVRYPHCRNQEMEHKFLNSKILHVVYSLVPSPHDYISTDVRHKQPKTLRTKALQQGKKDRCGMCPETTSELVFEKLSRNISRIMPKICPYKMPYILYVS